MGNIFFRIITNSPKKIMYSRARASSRNLSAARIAVMMDVKSEENRCIDVSINMFSIASKTPAISEKNASNTPNELALPSSLTEILPASV